MANIQVVDEIVKQSEALFSEFYRDDETAFVFTADHGMSKIGNHGDGGEVRVAPVASPFLSSHSCRPGQHADTADRMGTGRPWTPTRQHALLARRVLGAVWLVAFAPSRHGAGRRGCAHVCAHRRQLAY